MVAWEYFAGCAIFVAFIAERALRLRRLPLMGKMAQVVLALICWPLGALGAYFATGPIAWSIFIAAVGLLSTIAVIDYRYR